MGVRTRTGASVICEWCMLQISTGSHAKMGQCPKTQSLAGEIRMGPTCTWGEHSMRAICFPPRSYPAMAVPSSVTMERSTGLCSTR
jgi:hypothetical protein